MTTRIAWLAVLCLALVASQPGRITTTVPSTAPWTPGPSTLATSSSDTFVPDKDSVTGFMFGAWEFPGDILTSVGWSVTQGENFGTVYGSGTASGKNLTDQFISTNQYGYDIDKITVTGLNLPLSSGTPTGSTCRTRRPQRRSGLLG